MESITTAFQDIKSAFRKNVFLLILFIVILIFAIIGVLSLGVTAFLYSKVSSLETVVPITEDEEKPAIEYAQAGFSAAGGQISEISGNSITIEIPVGDVAEPRSFEVTAETTYAELKNDDSISPQSSLTMQMLAVGDTVTIYTNEEVGSVSPQLAVAVVKVLES